MADNEPSGAPKPVYRGPLSLVGVVAGLLLFGAFSVYRLRHSDEASRGPSDGVAIPFEPRSTVPVRERTPASTGGLRSAPPGRAPDVTSAPPAVREAAGSVAMQAPLARPAAPPPLGAGAALSGPPPKSSWEWLWREPSSFLLSKTALRSPEIFQAWLKDPAAMDRYLKIPVVNATLTSPKSLRLVLGNSKIVGAVLATPALADPPTVKAMAASPFAQRLLAAPAVQAFLSDPAAVGALMDEPGVSAWFAMNPEATRRLSDRR